MRLSSSLFVLYLSAASSFALPMGYTVSSSDLDARGFLDHIRKKPDPVEKARKDQYRMNNKIQHSIDKIAAKQTSTDNGGKVIIEWKQGCPETSAVSSIARDEVQKHWKAFANVRKFHYAEVCASEDKAKKRIEIQVRFYNEGDSPFGGGTVFLFHNE